MHTNNSRTPDKLAIQAEAHASQKSASNKGIAPTNGAGKIDREDRARLTERVLIYTRQAQDLIDTLSDQLGLSDRIQKQLLIAWIMIHHSTLPYHEELNPTLSEATLDKIIDLLRNRSSDSTGIVRPSGKPGGNGDSTDDTETSVLPQPLGPDSAPIIQEPKVKTPPPIKPRKQLGLDCGMER